MVAKQLLEFFIDEIGTFPGIPDALSGRLCIKHRDLFSLEFWQNVKSRVSDGEIIDVITYDRRKRSRRRTREARPQSETRLLTPAREGYGVVPRLAPALRGRGRF